MINGLRANHVDARDDCSRLIGPNIAPDEENRIRNLLTAPLRNDDTASNPAQISDHDRRRIDARPDRHGCNEAMRIRRPADGPYNHG